MKYSASLNGITFIANNGFSKAFYISSGTVLNKHVATNDNLYFGFYRNEKENNVMPLVGMRGGP
jgi:hypothetical protein